MLTTTNCAMKTVAENHPANSKESIVCINPTFSLVNALVYVFKGKIQINTYNALLGVGWTILCNHFHGAVHRCEH